ncbi:hypothetical protein ciss_12530 [Carboxydothermus islandicus]|uniref:Uncharacterized protein n=1 Tax=Carboxydothermus islandicus TaxID=661089 RepID=A0A1L8D2B6_9THEO|nr:hypothetical protein [Carboxydothermus islandicus]GAV25320.1 hypothetical protein ciss_12530 [Carboxydothermus islandicus]
MERELLGVDCETGLRKILKENLKWEIVITSPPGKYFPKGDPRILQIKRGETEGRIVIGFTDYEKGGAIDGL